MMMRIVGELITRNRTRIREVGRHEESEGKRKEGIQNQIAGNWWETFMEEGCWDLVGQCV